jgi:hypothetical protein
MVVAAVESRVTADQGYAGHAGAHSKLGFCCKNGWFKLVSLVSQLVESELTQLNKKKMLRGTRHVQLW